MGLEKSGSKPTVTMRAEFKVCGPEMSQYGLGSAGVFLLILFVFAICLYNSTFVLPEHSYEYHVWVYSVVEKKSASTQRTLEWLMWMEVKLDLDVS